MTPVPLSLFSPFPWLPHWISQQLWKLSPSVTLPHLCTLMPLAWDVLSLLTYLANSCLLLKTQSCGLFLCDTSHRIVHPFPMSPEVLALSSGEDGEWKESLGQVLATPQANSFNTVSLTPNSPGQQFQHCVTNTQLPCLCHLPPSWKLAAFLGALCCRSVNVAG